jgi:membrane protease YdiL (CAAX protease family)
MFLWDKSYNLKNFWYYILGSFIIILFSTLGQIPLMFFLPSEIPSPGSNPMEILKGIPSNLRLFLLLISFAITVPGIWLTVTKLHDLPFISVLTGRKQIDFERILYSFMIWGTAISSLVFIDYSLNPDDYQVNFKINEFIILFIIAISLIPIQISVEEIVFRGYLMQGFGNWFNSRFIALFLSSTVFGLLHFSNPEIDALGNKFIVQYISAGFILGIIALMDDGLELSIGLHAAQNLIGVLLLTADWTVLQTESILKYTADPEIRTVDLLISLSLYLIVILVFARKYSWTNWKEKLFSKVR